MEPHNFQNPSEVLASKADGDEQKASEWVGLCDDFVDLEGQYAVLCELLICLSRREAPLESAGRHGIDLFVRQLREHTAAFKRRLYKVRPD